MDQDKEVAKACLINDKLCDLYKKLIGIDFKLDVAEEISNAKTPTDRDNSPKSPVPRQV